ncbi:transmembrane and coiled-coil domain-containing protein 4-like [Impatiens glandulifera]|uniref:transmembrane and coiled-coil domain-containing protein 4-like n=1 Tax=Impatiens glandulifera TaxID=253017 RepID=UPI001FB19649|nr:transmembrane and coiled-coil domain-containing protein 4-like [Impatiens glandulifera]
MASLLAPSKRYAAGGLFGLALHAAQLHQTHPLGSITDQQRFNSCEWLPEDSDLWVHEKSGLLRPVFSILEIDRKSWLGLEEVARSSPSKGFVEEFLGVLSDESDDTSPEIKDKELNLCKALHSIVESMDKTRDIQFKLERHQQYKIDCQKKYGTIPESSSDEVPELFKGTDNASCKMVRTEQEGSHSGKAYESSLLEASQPSQSRKVTVLYELVSACITHTAEDCKDSAQKEKGYYSQHRVALRLLASWLNIKWNTMEAIEIMAACSAIALSEEKATDDDDEVLSPERSWEKWKRGGIVGAAALTGGTLMAITGGLAAPAIAAGLGALAPTFGTIVPVIGASGFAAAAGAAGTAAGSVAVAASFGVAGAGLTGTKMARRIGSIEEFEFIPIGENHNQERLSVEIVISGFVFEEEDFVMPWEGQSDCMERYALQWESENLIAVSTSIQDWLTSKVAMEFMKQGAMLTVLGTLVAALAWPATLLSATDFIDSKWAIALDRSDKAGKMLAEALMKGLQGQRPVTLIGFSLGARVIFKCLQFLAESGQKAHLVERVVLLGAPISFGDENWASARQVVAGRFVNAFSTDDWMLGIAFRASLLTEGLAGIQPIEVPGIENVNVTHLIEGHSSYLWATQQIIQELQLDSYYPVKGSLVKP